MKRMYSSDGTKSAPAWFVRSALVLAFLPIVAWAFVSILARDIGRAFKRAWLEGRIAIDDFKDYWNTAR